MFQPFAGGNVHRVEIAFPKALPSAFVGGKEDLRAFERRDERIGAVVHRRFFPPDVVDRERKLRKPRAEVSRT